MKSELTTSADVPQHMAALERANSVRLARAELKRAVARGDLDPADVVRDCPWQAESMTILELLTSQRRWGRTRARKFLVPLALNENKQLGTLSSRQRDLLAQSLAEKASLAEPSPSTQAESHQVGQELWDELVALSNRSNELTRELSRLAQRRDELIQSLSDLGAPRRAVAEAASLTVGRVQQIIDGSSKR